MLISAAKGDDLGFGYKDTDLFPLTIISDI